MPKEKKNSDYALNFNLRYYCKEMTHNRIDSCIWHMNKKNVLIDWLIDKIVKSV